MSGQFKWSAADKKKLLACKTPEEMMRAFPEKSVQNLIRRQTEFKNEKRARKVTNPPLRSGRGSVKNIDKKFFTVDDSTPTVHIIIPDTQAGPGRPTDHLSWIGKYIVDHFAGQANVKIIHLGDHADMPSLSSYDRGKKSMENRRVHADIQAANDAFDVLNEPLEAIKNSWLPEKHILHGNHEDRITRAVENDAQMEGLLDLDLLNYTDFDWEVHPFLKPVLLDGITYAHYFANPMTGKAYGGMASTRLKTIGTSFTMGHQQTLDYAIRFVGGKSQHALIVGACYLHDEDYKGYQGNAHWRGIVICHDVKDGSFDPMFVSLAYLCRRYEGMEIDAFVQKKYKMSYNGGW